MTLEAEHWPGSTLTVLVGGQVIAGFSASLICTEKPQPNPLPFVQVTEVVPTGKNEPEDGVQVTAPHDVANDWAEKLTTAPHCPGSFVALMFPGQVRVQLD